MGPERRQVPRGAHSDIVRKLFLKYEGRIGKMKWCREAIIAGPDVRGHLTPLELKVR